jgi:VCBS repeat-containing protein
VYSLAGAVSDNSLAGYDVSKLTGYGTMYLHSTTGAYTFVPVSAAIEALKATTSVDFTFTATDDVPSDTKTLSVTLNGVNDTPALQDLVGSDPVFGNESLTLSGDMAFTDADLTDRHGVTVTALGDGYIGEVTATITDSTSGVAGSAGRTVRWISWRQGDANLPYGGVVTVGAKFDVGEIDILLHDPLLH